MKTDERDEQGAAAPEGSSDGKPKRKGRRKAIVAATVVVVVVAAVVGFNIWHAQPSFCNAICHSPMDPYVQGYESGDSDLGLTAHAQTGVTCLQCHEAGIGQQVSEATKWLTGNFSDPLDSRREGIATRDFCFKCHDDGDAADGIDWDAIVASTADYGGEAGVNPHQSHNGNQDCGTCHSMHGSSELYCNQCHNMDLPDGWTNP